ncbi:MAG: serine/threonine protein kinase [Micrococcales bacterium]|nr:serine/threonine protein kinase [Micrococcales bacterium]
MSTQQPSRPEIAGHTVEGIIGRGATGIVWSGRDAMGRAVAIKVPHECSDDVDRRQGEIERHVLQAVRHEHLVPLRDVVGLADGRTALVFDLVEGASLASTVEARGRLRPGETVTVLTPLADAVSALHAAGGTHGDISARNVLVTAEGKPLLLDLGAARLAGAGSGAVHGTAGFVAPEVRAGDPPGEASDVFALGALAWFCLTGNGAPDTMMRLDPETIASHVGPQVAPVVGACIDPDPLQRPSSAELGGLFFHAAPAEPVEVAIGADEATALTNRLRLDAALDGPSMTQPGQGRTREAWARLGRARLGRARPGRALTLLRRGRGRRGSPSWPVVLRIPRRRLLTLALGLLLCTTLAAGWALSSRLPADGFVDGARPAGASSSAGSSSAGSSSPGSSASLRQPAKTSTGPVVGAATDATRISTVGDHPMELLQELTDRRADALTRRDVVALAGVHRPGADSERRDEQVIEQLRANGQVYSGLRLTVAEAALVSRTRTADRSGVSTMATSGPAAPSSAPPTSAPGGSRRGGDHVTVQARVDVSPYGVLQTGGPSLTKPAARGERLDFSLVRTTVGWRIETIRPARAR